MLNAWVSEWVRTVREVGGGTHTKKLKKRKGNVMQYTITKDGIVINSKDEFCPKHILECGQIFSYKKDGESYIVYSGTKKAIIYENENGFTIVTDDPLYFVNFFDLDTDYSEIKNRLINKYPFMLRPIEFGYGIRILRQDFLPLC